MNANNHDLHHLAGAYALDALDAEERRAFEAHYPTCDICIGEVEDFREIGAILAEGVETAPPTDLKAQIMAEVGQTRQVSPLESDTVVDLAEQRQRKSRLPLVLAAAAAAVVVVIGLASVLNGSSENDTEPVLAAPDAIVTNLEGEVGSLRIVWSDELDMVAIFGNDLAEPGVGMAYALWFVEADGVTPAALFTVEDDMVRIAETVDDIDPIAWGVTIEPDTGSPQPTGEILYLGEL